MKKIYLSSLLLVLAIFVYANYSGTVVTNQNELSFSTIDNYDVISIKNGFYTEEIGAPQLPVKILSFLIPADKKVSSIVINNTIIKTTQLKYQLLIRLWRMEESAMRLAAMPERVAADFFLLKQINH